MSPAFLTPAAPPGPGGPCREERPLMCRHIIVAAAMTERRAGPDGDR